MTTKIPIEQLRIGFIGSGFIAQFHLRALINVRKAEVCGVFSRSSENRQKFSGMVDEFDLGICIPLFFMRLGVKRMLLLGMAAWVLRYALFALGHRRQLNG